MRSNAFLFYNRFNGQRNIKKRPESLNPVRAWKHLLKKARLIRNVKESDYKDKI